MSATTRRPCPRCAATGTVAAHRNVLGGVCFRCRGAGTVPFRPGYAVMAVWATGEAQLCFVERDTRGPGVYHNDRDDSATYIVRANELVHIDLPGDVHNPSDELYLTVKRLAELARCAA